MTALTTVERVQVNAALSILHMRGVNAGAVTDQARAFVASGRTPAKAYEAAISGALKATPTLRGPVLRTMNLVAKSDPATVAKYDAALNSYIATGDETAINALEPMIHADSVALAVKEGQMTAEAAAAGAAVDWEAPMAEPAPAAGPAQSFSFNGHQAPADGAPAQPASPTRTAASFMNHSESYSAKATFGATGERAARAEREYAQLQAVSRPDHQESLAPASAPRGWVNRPVDMVAGPGSKGMPGSNQGTITPADRTGAA